MGTVIGQLLPLALGIAISPIPIIAGILMLMSPRARSTGVGFLIGWLVGIAAVTTVFTLLSSVLPEESEDTSKPILGTVQIVLGALLIFLAAKQWRSRPGDGVQPEMPKWMQQIDSMSFVAALGLGMLLSAVNPKNLLLGASAGLSLGDSTLQAGETTLLILLFVVLAGSTVLVPVVGFLVASERLRQPLGRLRDWLQEENAVIMTVVLLVLGAVVIGKGLVSFG